MSRPASPCAQLIVALLIFGIPLSRTLVGQMVADVAQGLRSRVWIGKSNQYEAIGSIRFEFKRARLALHGYVPSLSGSGLELSTARTPTCFFGAFEGVVVVYTASCLGIRSELCTLSSGGPVLCLISKGNPKHRLESRVKNPHINEGK
jgi:hypothetical protein